MLCYAPMSKCCTLVFFLDFNGQVPLFWICTELHQWLGDYTQKCDITISSHSQVEHNNSP